MARPLVHLVNPLWDANGGADRRTLDTQRTLAGVADVRLWTEYEPNAAFAREHDILRIRPARLTFPRGGTLVFVGVYFRIGHWVHFARPSASRRALQHRSAGPPAKEPRTPRAHRSRARNRLHISGIASTARRRPVQYWKARSTSSDSIRHRVRAVRDPSPSGRMSRDIRSKHHEEDPALVARAGLRGLPRSHHGRNLPRARIARRPQRRTAAGRRRRRGDVPARSRLLSSIGRAGTGSKGMDAWLPRPWPPACRSWPDAPAATSTTSPTVSTAALFDATPDAAAAVLSLQRDRALASAYGAAARAAAERINRDWIPRRTIELLAGLSRYHAEARDPARHATHASPRPSPCDPNSRRSGVVVRRRPCGAKYAQRDGQAVAPR